MAIKFREAEELRLSTRKKLTATSENWIRFLRTASNTYKYSYQDQLMIAAQFPQAKAVAAFDVWSDRFGRKIRAGEKGIGLIDDSGNRPRMKYVFDISQSERFRDIPQPYVWDLREEYQNEVALYLAGDLSVPIEQAVSDFCENMVDSLLSDYENELIANSADSTMLFGLDEMSITAEFRQAVLESVKYVVLTRCGLDTSIVDEDVFRNLINFSDVNITDILGTAISNISEQALREIETTVKTIERRNQNEHNIEKQDDRRSTAPTERGGYDILSDSERGQADRFDIYSRSRNIRVSAEPDSNGGREGNRDLGQQTQEVSEKSKTDIVYADVRQSQPDGSPDRSEQSGRENDGRTRNGDDGAGRRDRATESNRSDGMGTQSELDTDKSRGNRTEQSDLRITQKTKQQRKIKRKAEERPVSPVFSSFVGEQMSLFAPEKTEQDIINEYVFQRLINAGTGFENGKFRIQAYFSEQHTNEEKAKFLNNEFGWGGSYNGSEEFESRPGKGLTMKHIDKENPDNNITVHLTYPQVVDYLDYLVSNDLYITQDDVERRQQNAIYTLKNADPDNPLDVPRIERAKEILDSYNIDYTLLLENQPVVEKFNAKDIAEMNATISDDTEIPDIDSPSVTEDSEETFYSESAIVAEFRNRTDESFHLIGGRTAFDIELEVEQLLQQEMDENEIVGEIEDVVLYGSRCRGLEDSEQSDIDVVVEINGSELKEDALFNIFADLNLEIDGIPVDVNPIRPEETGTLQDYLPKAEAYLEQKQAEKSEKIFSSSDDNDEQVGLKVPLDSLTVNIIYTENPILNRLVENYKSSNDTISFAGMNTLLKYLDEKQHLERLNQNLSVGWYDKTDFEIKAVIDGEEFTYSGRFDIGDGKGTGGGSLIDHISDYTDYTLSPNNPYHLSAEELAEKQKIKDILIPFLRKNEQLTQSDEDLIGAVKRTDPIRTTEKQYNNLIGKTVTYDSREYVVEGIDLKKDKAKIRDDNTGWYPLFQDVNLQDIVSQNIDLIETPEQENTPQATEQQENTQSITPEITENYHITDLSLGQRKPLEKFNDNLAAIRTLKQLEAEDRSATPEEQETLSKYTGWGGMSKVFEPDNKYYNEVRSLLTDDEFAAARKSTMTAFYTSPVIIKEMYAKLAEMGMNGGKLLEPSCGIGNFIGMIPGNNTQVTGIELDSLTGRIAQKLYPQAQIQVCGFENSKLKENSFDVAVGNRPVR